MKKFLVSILFFVLASVQLHPQTIKSGLTGWNKVDSSLYSPVYRPQQVIVDSTFRTTYSYDFPGQLICRLSETLYNGSWFTSSTDSMNYDNNGNMLTYLSKSYSNGTTVASTFKVTYEYDSNGKILVTVMEQSMNGSYLSGMRTTYTYDAKGNLETILTESAAFNGWTNLFKNTYTYDDKGNMLTNLSEAWDNDAWRNGFKDTYTYDGSGSRLTLLRETWIGSGWENFTRITYTYNTGNLITSLEEEWLNNAWTNKSRLTFTYDAKGYLTGDLNEQWGDGAWTNSVKHLYANDADGNAVKGESFKWDMTGKWVPHSTSMGFHYTNYQGKKEILTVGGSVVSVMYETPIVGVENTAVTVNNYGLLQNYPNPFNPSTTINYSLKKEGNARLTVFDALGKMVAVVVNEYKPAGTYSVKFNAGSLPSGIYIYRLESGGFTAAKKFILMK